MSVCVCVCVYQDGHSFFLEVFGDKLYPMLGTTNIIVMGESTPNIALLPNTFLMAEQTDIF